MNLPISMTREIIVQAAGMWILSVHRLLQWWALHSYIYRTSAEKSPQRLHWSFERGVLWEMGCNMQ